MYNFKIDSEIIKDFSYLGSVIILNWDWSWEATRRLILRGAEVEELGSWKDVLLEHSEDHHTLVLLITMYECESWTARKAAGKKNDSFEIWCWRRALRIPWTALNMNRWVLEQIKPETSLEAKMTKLKLFYFGHIMRTQGSLENTMMLRKTECSRKTRPNMRWIDSLEGTIDMSL